VVTAVQSVEHHAFQPVSAHALVPAILTFLVACVLNMIVDIVCLFSEEPPLVDRYRDQPRSLSE
jgi:hypothetical protein